MVTDAMLSLPINAMLPWRTATNAGGLGSIGIGASLVAAERHFGLPVSGRLTAFKAARIRTMATATNAQEAGLIKQRK